VQTFSRSHGLACNHEHDYDHLLVHNEQEDSKMATTTRPPATRFPDILSKTKYKTKASECISTSLISPVGSQLYTNMISFTIVVLLQECLEPGGYLRQDDQDLTLYSLIMVTVWTTDHVQ